MTKVVDKPSISAALATKMVEAAVRKASELKVAQVARVSAIGGGFPVTINGSVVGAIGVSGGSIEADVACAKAGLDAIG